MAADGAPPAPAEWHQEAGDAVAVAPPAAVPTTTRRLEPHPNAPPTEAEGERAPRRVAPTPTHAPNSGEDAERRPARPTSASTLAAFSGLAAQPGLTPVYQIPPAKRPPSLDAVRQALGRCTRCPLHEKRTNIVFGVGNPQARLLFIGEGPGANEDAQGIPFVGAAGELLTRIIGAMGLQRDEVYIANIVKCRPPGNRDPLPAEVAQCEPFLLDQITVIQPEVIVTLGRIAAHALLKITTPITRLRGHWQEYRGVPVMPTLHPAYLLRTPAAKRFVWDDMQEVMRRLGLRGPSAR